MYLLSFDCASGFKYFWEELKLKGRIDVETTGCRTHVDTTPVKELSTLYQPNHSPTGVAVGILPAVELGVPPGGKAVVSTGVPDRPTNFFPVRSISRAAGCRPPRQARRPPLPIRDLPSGAAKMRHRLPRLRSGRLSWEGRFNFVRYLSV
jgi:hypothetical protein